MQSKTTVATKKLKNDNAPSVCDAIAMKIENDADTQDIIFCTTPLFSVHNFFNFRKFIALILKSIFFQYAIFSLT